MLMSKLLVCGKWTCEDLEQEKRKRLWVWRAELDLLSGPADSEEEDEEAGREQLPDEEDGTERQVASVAEFTLQVSLKIQGVFFLTTYPTV